MPQNINNVLTAILDFLTKNAGTFFSAMTGAFFGAISAYWSERLKERRKKRVEEHGAIVGTQMALIGQFNTVRNVQKQHLEPFKSDPQREAKLITFHMTDTSLRVAYDSISFLLMTQNTNLVSEIHSAEQSYLSVMELLVTRNQALDNLHKNSTLEKFDPQTGKCTIAIKDPRDIKMLKDLTDALYTSADNACERLSAQIIELEKAGKLLYPKNKFLKIIGEK